MQKVWLFYESKDNALKRQMSDSQMVRRKNAR